MTEDKRDITTLNPATKRNKEISGGRQAQSLPAKSQIVVVGAGVMGGWTALYLLRAGFHVTLIDAWGPGNSRASSGGESRLIRAIYGSNEIYSQLVIKAFDLWQEHQNGWPQPVMIPTGVLWFSHPGQNEILEPARDIIDKYKLPYEEMTPSEASRRYPMINCDDLESVILENNAGYLKPSLACRLVMKQFVSEGGQYVAGQARPVLAVGQLLSSVEVSDGSSVTADAFIFACGPWLKELFPGILGDSLRITKQEIHYFGVPESWLRYGQLPGWIDLNLNDIYYGIPGDLSRGFKVAHDKRGPEFDPMHGDRIPSTEEIEAAKKYIAHRFPSLANAPVTETRVCQYSNSLDGNLFVDQHPQYDNLWLMGGGSGHSFKYGPALGELAANIIQGKAVIPELFRLLQPA